MGAAGILLGHPQKVPAVANPHISGIRLGDQVHDDDEGQGGSSLYCLSVEPGVEQA